MPVLDQAAMYVMCELNNGSKEQKLYKHTSEIWSEHNNTNILHTEYFKILKLK